MGERRGRKGRGELRGMLRVSGGEKEGERGEGDLSRGTEDIVESIHQG